MTILDNRTKTWKTVMLKKYKHVPSMENILYGILYALKFNKTGKRYKFVLEPVPELDEK